MEEIFNKIDEILERKKQIILYGVPGVGKTYLARKYVEKFVSQTSNNNYENKNNNGDVKGYVNYYLIGT